MNSERFRAQNLPESDLETMVHRLEKIKDELDALRKWNTADPHPRDIDRIESLESEAAEIKATIRDRDSLSFKDDFVGGPDAHQLEMLDEPVAFDWKGVDYKTLRQLIANDSDLSEIYSQAKKDLDPSGDLISRKAALLRMSELINDDRNSLPGRVILNKFNDLISASKNV